MRISAATDAKPRRRHDFRQQKNTYTRRSNGQAFKLVSCVTTGILQGLDAAANYGRGAGVGRGLGVGERLPVHRVEVAVGVGVAVGVAVAVAVAVAVGVAVAFGVAEAVIIGVGVPFRLPALPALKIERISIG